MWRADTEGALSPGASRSRKGRVGQAMLKPQSREIHGVQSGWSGSFWRLRWRQLRGEPLPGGAPRISTHGQDVWGKARVLSCLKGV